MTLILAATAALHKGRDHVDGSRRFDPLINRHQQKGLRPPTGRARAAHALGIHIRQRCEEVNHPNAVPQLQAQRADPPQGLAPPPNLPMHELVAVVVADHVVRKGHHALPREVDAATRNRPQLGVFETPPPPVAVRTGKRRKGALAQRPVQIATDKEARQALEKDLFHRIALPLNPPEDLRLERRLLRQRPQSRANENVPANRRRPLLPLR